MNAQSSEYLRRYRSYASQMLQLILSRTERAKWHLEFVRADEELRYRQHLGS